MNELSDNEFDRLLKQKAEAFDYDFDESAWDKMEKKLRRRDRIIFIRNSSVIAFLLLLFGGGLFILNTNPVQHPQKVAKTTIQKDKISPINLLADKSKGLTVAQNFNDTAVAGLASYERKAAKESKNAYRSDAYSNKKEGFSSDFKIKNRFSQANDNTLAKSDNADILVSPDTNTLQLLTAVNAKPDSVIAVATVTDTTSGIKDIIIKNSKRPALSFTVMAGPEFSYVGSQRAPGSINIGFLTNVSLSRLTLSSGARYGKKNYQATSGYYKVQNSSRSAYISGIDASCNILEIPLQLSYAVANDSHKKIQFTSGLSSYLMLKEEYNFKYSPQSGYKDYLLVKNNAHQHYFSVLNLSASYQVKNKSSKILWAIEPYVKLPLAGVGEGSVHLKSSGISLNLIYDTRKKNK